MIRRTTATIATLLGSRRALRVSLSLLVLGLPVSALAQTPPAPAGGGAPPVSGGGSGMPTAPGTAGQKPAVGSGATSAAPVSSAAVVKLKKEIQGDFGYRFVSANGETALTALTPLPAATGTDVLVGVPSNVDAKTAKLEVLDNTRGNLARFAIKTDAPLTLNESSFTYAQRINVPVQKGGLGVIGAQVTLADAAKTYNKTTTLQPSDGGLARFDNVPLGKELTATVSYTEHKISVTQNLPAARTGEGWAPMTVDWVDAKTVAPPVPVAVPGTPAVPSRGDSAESGSHRDRAEAQTNTNPFAGVFSTLISLLFLGGIFYGLYWLYQTGRLKNVFDKLGLSNAVMATDAGSPAPSPFDKPTKPAIQPITDGTADPFGGIGMAGGGMGAAPAPVVSGPRLVATMGTYAGSIFPLLGPSMDIGRDAGNPIPLPNDTNASRRHATVQITNGQVVLVDNGSSNGTYVNGVRIAGQTPQPLRSGDEVNIGNTRFRFEA
jgi:hypothetical protein